ncbi:ChaN family lipoprotein [Marinobacter salicampi]|uniref:ChaN family lipoprotein n=1 Tax=Marinobacter salicampi TaxID=435907 RepID=UPI00140B6926|nr:ChaN family lipoprotein [Marinobacter salicampi]
MTKSSILLLLGLALFLPACAGPGKGALDKPQALQSLYDFHLVSAKDGQPQSLEQVVQQLADVDVVFIGEYHGHNGAHYFQARMLAELHRQQPDLVLSMEQFTIEHQATLNQYLKGEIGEATLLEEAEAWPNYRASYRPLVEFARSHSLPVIAANAPADVVRCVGRVGADYLDHLEPSERSELPEAPFFTVPAYEDKFAAAMGQQNRGIAGGRLFHAQLLRDNTMAKAILEAYRARPGQQIIHVNGTFHSEEHLGTVAALAWRDPDLSIRVVSPVIADNPDRPELKPGDSKKGDQLYMLRELPKDYVDPERQREMLKRHHNKAADPACDSPGQATGYTAPTTKT